MPKKKQIGCTAEWIPDQTGRSIRTRESKRLQKRDFALVVPKPDQSGFELVAKVFPDVVPKQ